jgi:hypothetical protein
MLLQKVSQERINPVHIRRKDRDNWREIAARIDAAKEAAKQRKE